MVMMVMRVMMVMMMMVVMMMIMMIMMLMMISRQFCSSGKALRLSSSEFLIFRQVS